MTDEAWPFWIKHFYDCIPSMSERGNIILILDGYGSHSASLELLEDLEKEGIYLFALPAHTSSRLQPLDVGIFGPLKVKLRKAFQNWMKVNSGISFRRQYFPEFLGNRPMTQKISKLAFESVESGLITETFWTKPPLNESYFKPLTPIYSSMSTWLHAHPEDELFRRIK
eukprot:Pompholyxophrys_punicea_v1_NODE_808_length_1266_cov_3.870355.p1 type:complete len:169 gc:universal NODE_808_length_1266_cov_3.870355:562-1068(+)